MSPSLAIIVRTADERTVSACVASITQQVGDVPVRVVCERPFEAALRRTYELGLEFGHRWTMTVDGDVLARRGAVLELLAEAERLPSDYVQIEGRIHDKILGMYRYAGHRIYRHYCRRR